MKYYKLTYCILIIIVLLINFSCREEIELKTDTFESVLVVEATITNELKRHEVKISRTYLLEQEEQVIENNAEVRVTDNTGNSFNFSQNTEGVYLSDAAFEALPNLEYKLSINTTNGKTYNSNIQSLTPISQIDNLYAEAVDDDVNGPGIQIFVDSQNSNPETKHFRYEFEETYKIVAPSTFLTGVIFSNYYASSSPSCGIIVSYDVEFYDKTGEEEICFSSNKNLNIIQTTSSNLSENNISRFPIRFLAEDNEDDVIDVSVLRDRYSIKVRQFVQSIEAYNYYRILSLLGDNSSVLSETQPGFVEGNLSAISANSDRVIGFFEVASVTEQRFFFNYQDVNITLPNYIYNCDEQIWDYNDNVDFPCGEFDFNERNQLYLYVTRENYKLTNYDEDTNIYTIAKQECVNCTSAGTNIQPDFWVD